MKHSEHYPTFIEHPRDPSKRALVQTPWLHHKQLKQWGLEGLDPEPAAPADAAAARPVHDPEYPKIIEHPNTHKRVQVAHAQAELAQLTAWGFGPKVDDDDEDDDLVELPAGAMANAWTYEWKGAHIAAPQCRTVRGQERCKLTQGHKEKHDFKGATGGAGNG